MIYITINSKGGVGKSTFASSILTAYLFVKNKEKTKLIEIDDENKDSIIFNKTKIFDSKIIKTKEIEKIDEIFFTNDDVIIDIGGNKTASLFLQEIEKIGLQEKEFTKIVWCIPLGRGMQDGANALDTHNFIKNIDANAKILFVLSASNSENQEELEFEFLNFFGHKILKTPFAIMQKEYITDVKYVSVKNSNLVNNSRSFFQTIFDISLNETDYATQLREIMREIMENKKSNLRNIELEDKLERTKFYNRMKITAKAYVDYMEKDLFKQINKELED